MIYQKILNNRRSRSLPFIKRGVFSPRNRGILMPSTELNAISETIIGSAIEVHRALGPGLLESAYEACLMYELLNSGLKVEQQKPLPIAYKNTTIDCGYRLDIIVEDSVIIELKSVEQILPIHKSQLLSYLRLSGLTLGLLINFNVELLKQGLHRVVNKFETSASSATSALKIERPPHV